MNLITELVVETEVLTELNESGQKNLYIVGPFLQANIRNRNGREYPLGIMEREVDRYVNERVKMNTAFGELNHPATPQINFERVSHIIKELKQDGNNFIGKALITNTPMGNIVRGIMEGGGRPGVSSRGVGSLKMNSRGNNEVQEDFRLATAADIVSDPSAPDAWVNGIMEGVDWVYDEKLGFQARSVVEAVKTAVHNGGMKVISEEVRMAAFKKFLGAVQNCDFSK